MDNNTNDILRATVDGCFEKITACVDGKLYRDCDGEFVIIDDDERDDDGEEIEKVSLGEYLEDIALSIDRFIIDVNGNIVGGRIIITFGGPNIYATEDGIFGYWGRDSVEKRYMPASSVSDEILEFLRICAPDTINK